MEEAGPTGHSDVLNEIFCIVAVNSLESKVLDSETDFEESLDKRFKMYILAANRMHAISHISRDATALQE